MDKRLNLFFFFCTATVLLYAQQWTPKDSINLRRLLDGDGEIKLNTNALKDIDLGSFVGTPMMSTEKPGLKFDATLPTIPNKRNLQLTLTPYTARTKFNYDPIYKRKIKVGPNTWRNDTLSYRYGMSIYSNWAKKPFDGGQRKSLDEIEASGLRYNPIGERANNMPVGAWTPTPTQQGRSGRMTVSASGTTIGGLDLMKPFTREFWDKKGRERRERTLELLKSYGDSTTILINKEIKPIKKD
ncbi:DUF4858 domain-containing protein [Bacteroides sp. OttesenSCG-928-E20]|nr:DUF4858 domain-containing protein [Bacteroides sp. OttesenSCG-928-N06]MDL2299518.1 DUF4858 domain-containing protein [Bacteroides sp. OttesenSCG-928-E20]